MNDTKIIRAGLAMSPVLGLVLAMAALMAFLSGCAELRRLQGANDSDTRGFWSDRERVKY